MPNVNGFEIDWIVNGRSQSPVSKTRPVCGHDADAEVVGVGLAQFRDIGGDLAIRQRLVPSVQLFDRRLQFVLFHEGPSCHPAIPVPLSGSQEHARFTQIA